MKDPTEGAQVLRLTSEWRARAKAGEKGTDAQDVGGMMMALMIVYSLSKQ